MFTCVSFRKPFGPLYFLAFVSLVSYHRMKNTTDQSSVFWQRQSGNVRRLLIINIISVACFLVVVRFFFTFVVVVAKRELSKHANICNGIFCFFGRIDPAQPTWNTTNEKKKKLINGIWRALVVFLVFLRVSAHYYVSRGPNRWANNTYNYL